MKMMLAQGEVMLYEGRPEKNLLRMWLITKVLPIATLASLITEYAVFLCWIFVVLIPSGDKHAPFPVHLLRYLYLIVPSWFVGMFVYYARLKETFRYYITDQRCVYEGGIFVKRMRSVSFHKITDVEINQNIFERSVGLASVKVFTPGTGSVGMPGFEKAEVVFCGLKDPEKPAGILQDSIRKGKATGE